MLFKPTGEKLCSDAHWFPIPTIFFFLIHFCLIVLFPFILEIRKEVVLINRTSRWRPTSVALERSWMAPDQMGSTRHTTATPEQDKPKPKSCSHASKTSPRAQCYDTSRLFTQHSFLSHTFFFFFEKLFQYWCMHTFLSPYVCIFLPCLAVAKGLLGSKGTELHWPISMYEF